MRLKKWDLLICIGLAFILSIFAVDLGNTNPAARTYPMVMVIASYFFIAIIAIRWIINKKQILTESVGGMSGKRFLYIAIYCAAIFAYIMLIDKLGYVVSTVIFGIYSLIYLKNRNKVVTAVLPVVAAFLLYFLFSKFLFVRLPAGILM